MRNNNNYVGKTVKVVNTTSGHGWVIGSLVKIVRTQGTYFYGDNGDYMLKADFVETTISVEDMEKEVKEMESNIETMKNRISYMKENSLEEYDENEFRVYNTLKIIDKEGLSQMEKAKEIAKLINN